MERIQTKIFFIFFLSLTACFSSCHYENSLMQGQYLLKSNRLNIVTKEQNAKKIEIKENCNRLILQKPNTYRLGFPYKLAFYQMSLKNGKSTIKDTLNHNYLEFPIYYDSILQGKSVEYIKAYMFNQGYFFATVTDTVLYKKNKANVVYNVTTGPKSIIGKVQLDIDDSTIFNVINKYMYESKLQKNAPFCMSMLEEERIRLVGNLKEFGYYKFTQENIVDFNLDTLRIKSNRLKDSIIDLTKGLKSLFDEETQRVVNVKITIRRENQEAYKRFKIRSVKAFPDFRGVADLNDNTLYAVYAHDIEFRFHEKYINEKTLVKHIYLEKGKFFAQSDYDATVSKLNQLGVFQTVRLVILEDTSIKDEKEGLLDVYVLLTPADKYDFTSSLEVSTATTYFLGVTPTISVRNRNVFKGANLFTASISGGIETFYDQNKGSSLRDQLYVLTKNYGFNMNLDMPKFLSPFKVDATKRNLPRTILSLGTGFLDRTNYFTLTNTTASLTYKWRETSTKNWELSPLFFNIIRRPSTSADFQARIDSNAFLANSYRENYIMGENLVFSFSNQFENNGRGYSYLRLSLEEAGGIPQLLDKMGVSNFPYARYWKIDFDARRYFNQPKSQWAFRFYGGFGLPYGSSGTLPYVKQYFVGGAYSIRGWRIRSLGPGSYYDSKLVSDTAKQSNSVFIDRTGDIKLEMNGEYRFDIAQLFGGAIKVTGAAFADAGNIWLYKPSPDYVAGEFAIDKLANDVAISTGLGLRFNLAGFFIFRIDAAFPIKKPYSAAYDYGGWVLENIKFSDNTWRSNNLIINFAIGTPF